MTWYYKAGAVYIREGITAFMGWDKMKPKTGFRIKKLKEKFSRESLKGW